MPAIKMGRLALKVLLEGNASSQQLEVLYLASIYSNGDSFRIEVIDRWYDINSAVDAILVQIIRNGGLCVGDKISCAGPHANGLSEGALPLFDTAKSALLSLTGNSVRRDRWHTKLGFQPKRMMYMSLSAVHELGGPIGAALDVTILRSYAMLYVETMATDQRVVRTEKEEQRIGVTFTEKRTMLLQEVL
ncbi:Breast cancer 2, early onset [Coemansia spiralis]|uniref:Breast cancer 2, early onset n=2 Tax=Coemansia TaxID=4863 RepID=A0A9W8GCX9_9FUNG|nr:Breast cancer 2, early onset [Coemansia umbellata]KAJ2680839.1 Breast cancer 2, early onset [Coemansia spiralis]